MGAPKMQLVLLLLLAASGGAASGDDGAGRPHVQLCGIEDSGGGHASDASPQPQGQGLMDYLQFTHGCGRFAALLATTPNTSEFFREHVFAGAGSGLTVFCPDNVAVAAFEPKFNNLSADDQLAVLLHHGAVARYGRDQLAAFESVTVRTLASDAATNKSYSITLRDDGDTVWIWPSPPSRGSGRAARVTMEVSSGDSPIAIYVVDAVMLPDHLRQHLDGGDEAAECTRSGWFLGWLHCYVPIWVALRIAASAVAGVLTGTLARFFILVYFCSPAVLERV